MALRPDRSYSAQVDVSRFWHTTPTTAEKGGVASLQSAGSGVSLDDTSHTVTYKSDPSGATAVGVLLQPVAPELSSDRDFPNFDKGEIRPGDKCSLVRKGWVVTDMIPSGITIAAGDTAYLAASGKISNVEASGAPTVGRWETSKDSDGFAKLFVDV